MATLTLTVATLSQIGPHEHPTGHPAGYLLCGNELWNGQTILGVVHLLTLGSPIVVEYTPV